MSYTIRQLAELSGVSIRTLHWYDQVGLLPPAYHGSNGRRYYEEGDLLLLQQILFFKEVGFKLADIQRVLSSSRFDRIRALQVHRKKLQQRIARNEQLIATINQTILHLRGSRKMGDEQIYDGFGESKQKEYEQYLVKHRGTVAEELIAESRRRTKEWSKEDFLRAQNEGQATFKALSQLIDAGATPRSPEVQRVMQKHYEMVNHFYTATKEVYCGLAEMYCEHPDFRKYFERYHHKLADFLAEAMRVFARDHLS